MGDKGASEGKAASAAGGECVCYVDGALCIANRYFLLDKATEKR